MLESHPIRSSSYRYPNPENKCMFFVRIKESPPCTKKFRELVKCSLNTQNNQKLD